jgi:phosphoesterase RecJ-like protein
MMNETQFAVTLDRLLKQSQRILLTMTTGPDGDSIGSLLAMCHIVHHYGKTCFCYSPDPIPPMFHFLTKDFRIMREMADPVHDYDLVIIFDTGDIRRSPLAEELIQRSAKTVVVNIDHHPTTTDYRGQSAVDHSHVDTGASSTTQMMHRLLHHLKVPYNRHLATSVLTGLLTDRGHFSNLGTTQEAMAIAAELMAKGADHKTITEATMRNKSIGTLQLWGRALSRLTLNTASGIASTVITLDDLRECNVDSEASTGISNFLNSLHEGKVALVLQEEPGGIVKGSLRTTSDINVADIAKQFGGGGHAKAAGFKVKGKLVKTSRGWSVEPLVSMDNV